MGHRINHDIKYTYVITWKNIFQKTSQNSQENTKPETVWYLFNKRNAD